MEKRDFERWTNGLINGIRDSTLSRNGHPFVYFAVTREQQHLVWLVDDEHLLSHRDVLAQMMLAINIAFDTIAYAVAMEAWALEIDPRIDAIVIPSQSERRTEMVELIAFSANGADRVWHGRIVRNDEGRIAAIDESKHVGRVSSRYAGLYPPKPISTNARAAIRDLVTALTSVQTISCGTA